MKLGIMQPYFFPYIGYFQLINSVDKFVIYDNIEYTKKGWINRNNILSPNGGKLITLPLKKDSDFLNVNQRFLSDSWVTERKKLLNVLKSNYSKSEYFEEVFCLLESCILFENLNLFDFILFSLKKILSYLEVKTEIIKSSDVDIDHKLKSEKKVIEICKTLKAETYINSIGGMDLYDKNEFKMNGIHLNFIKSNDIIYKQYNNEFIPWLSVIDILMFNSKDKINEHLNNYKLL